MQTLERINRVGMATKILDTMSDDSKELRDKTRAELVKFLFLQDLSEEKLHSSKTKKRDEKPEDSR